MVRPPAAATCGLPRDELRLAALDAWLLLLLLLLLLERDWRKPLRESDGGVGERERAAGAVLRGELLGCCGASAGDGGDGDLDFVAGACCTAAFGKVAAALATGCFAGGAELASELTSSMLSVGPAGGGFPAGFEAAAAGVAFGAGAFEAAAGGASDPLSSVLLRKASKSSLSFAEDFATAFGLSKRPRSNLLSKAFCCDPVVLALGTALAAGEGRGLDAGDKSSSEEPPPAGAAAAGLGAARDAVAAARGGGALVGPVSLSKLSSKKELKSFGPVAAFGFGFSNLLRSNLLSRSRCDVSFGAAEEAFAAAAPAEALAPAPDFAAAADEPPCPGGLAPAAPGPRAGIGPSRLKPSAEKGADFPKSMAKS